jgi:hypothetical protein
VALLLGLVVVGLGVARAVRLPFLHGPHGYVLADPDSAMRWRLVERALAGEGLFPRVVDDDNAPLGRFNEWTAPMTLVGVAAVKVASLAGGPAAGERTRDIATWIGPLLGFLVLLLLGWLGWRAGGWTLALAWLVAWPALVEVEAATALGNVDHHGLHLLFSVAMVAGWLRAGRHPARTGAALGLVCAAYLWSAASESMVFVGAAAALAVGEVLLGPAEHSRVQAWRAWWQAGVLGTAAALLLETGMQPFHDRLEVISPWHVLLWVLVGGLVEAGARWRLPLAARLGLLAGAGVVATLVALGVRGLNPSQLHVLASPTFQRMSALLQNSVSPFRDGLAAGLGDYLTDLGLLPLGLVACAWAWRRLAPPERAVTLLALLLLALSAWQTRWSLPLAAPLVMATGLGLTRLLPHRPRLVVALVALATLGPWLTVVERYGQASRVDWDPRRGPEVTAFALDAVTRDVGDARRRPVVLAPWYHGANLAGSGRVRVLGSQYWSNQEGTAASLELWGTTNDARFLALLRERQVAFIMLPDQGEAADAVAEGMAFLRGLPPGAPVEVEASALWRLATSPARVVVETPQVASLRPGWMVLRAPREAGELLPGAPPEGPAPGR